MSKEVNFRIIELPTHQVLLMKDFNNDDEENPDVMTLTVFHDGVKLTQTYGYKDKEKRDEMFEKVTELNAQSTLDSILKMVQ